MVFLFSSFLCALKLRSSYVRSRRYFRNIYITLLEHLTLQLGRHIEIGLPY